MRLKSIILSLLLLFCTATCSGALRSETWRVPPGLAEYQVLKVVDGDTIWVQNLGKVRYTGIDAPEIKHSDREAEPYGYEAMEANRRLVLGKRVKIELDTAKRDRYGRVLAYVYSGPVFVNAYLIEAGYAYPVKVKPNVKYYKLFVRLQTEAAESGRGLWGLQTSKTNRNQH